MAQQKRDYINETGLSEWLVTNYIGMKDSEIPKETKTIHGREHEDAVKKLLDRAAQVRDLRDAGLSITIIAQETGFGLTTVKNYLSESFSPINTHYGKQREGKLAPFWEEVFQLRVEGLAYKEIHNRIKAKGYSGTQDAIRGVITKEKRTRRDLSSVLTGGEIVEFVNKKWMMKLLDKPDDKVKGITEEQLTAIFDNYPLAKVVFDLVKEFKELLKTINAALLKPWIEKAVATEAPEFETFVNGIKNDLVAVMNAFTSDISNGLVEGTINKIKVIKRDMYGRCHFDLLRNKCLSLDYIH